MPKASHLPENNDACGLRGAARILDLTVLRIDCVATHQAIPKQLEAPVRFRHLAVLILFAACQPAAPPEMTDADRAEVEQAIADRWAAFENAVMSRDVEEYLPFWTQDARILEPGMNMGGSELQDFFTEFWGSGGEVFSFDLESYEIFVHGDVAYQIGQYDESFQFPDAEP